ncbi:MAG: chemotaxis protein CheW, partial [Bacteroidota bacterium]
EIVQLPKLSRTPNTPNHIKGVANVRGDTYVVFDLSTRFQVSEETEARYLLIIGHSEVKAGLQLPLLPSTFKVDGKSISSEMNMIEDASLDVSYIKGIIQYEEKLIYYLDIIEMLQSDKAVVVPDKILAKEG